MKGSLDRWGLALAVGLLAVLLVCLAVLQYRWTGEVSAAEEARLRQALAGGAAALALDFDREITRAFLHFQPPPGRVADGFWAGRMRAWRGEVPYPGLVASLERAVVAEEGPRLERLDEEAGRFVSLAWPPELQPLRQRLIDRAQRQGGMPPRADGLRPRRPLPGGPGGVGRWLLLDEVPAILVPGAWGAGDGSLEGPGEPRGGQVLVVRLDLGYITAELLPLLAERHLGGLAGGVVMGVDDAEGREIWAAGGGATDPRRAPEAEARLFALLPPEELRPLWVAAALPPGLLRRPAGAPSAAREMPPLGRLLGPGAVGAWRLVVAHPEGGLEGVVDRTRRRNLAVGSVALLLLGATGALLAVAARRAFALARQRSALVAAASHELRTPLAAIRGLGQNLSDGLVEDGERVRRYGESIVREGERLGSLVEQMLELGRIRGQARLERLPIDVGALIAAAVEGVAPLAVELGVEVERLGSPPGATVRGDRDALHRALENLLTNALRHGGTGRWVGIGAEDHAGRRPEVRIRVADRGPGISRRDLPHIFEPFYRGAGGDARGGGLGLALVREIAGAHGGRVEVSSQPARGSTFTLRLPAARPEEAG